MIEPLAAVALLRKIEKLEEAARRTKNPDKAADLRFQAWILRMQLKYGRHPEDSDT